MKATDDSSAASQIAFSVSYPPASTPRSYTSERRHLVKSFYASRGVGSSACNIYYELYAWRDSLEQSDCPPTHQVVFIAGLACSGSTWRSQLTGLLNAEVARGTPGRLELCVIDNRGIGQSSAPHNKKLYTTTIMAQDVIAVMNDLGWQKAHVVGFSMGGMIATKVAAMEPDRIETLTLLSVTAGGFSSIPRTWLGLKYFLQGALARTPEGRADLDLKFHFTEQTLQQQVEGLPRRDSLHREYLGNSKVVQQETWGLHGQLHAVWQHKVTKSDILSITSRGIPVVYIHGRHDLLASYRSAERLAERMRAQFVLLEGAHFILRECGHEVNMLLDNIILGHNPEMNRMRFMDPIEDPSHIEIKMNCT